MEIRDSMTGLVNKLTGQGTDSDKITSQEWYFAEPRPEQLRNSYRSNWLCRKAVDIPTFDMMRQGWTWEADEKDRKKIEAHERKHKVKQKVWMAQRIADLYGGAAIVLGDGSSNPELPLNPQSIRSGGLKYMTVLTRFEISSGIINHDVLSPDHNLPQDYMISGTGENVPRIHPSRVVRFTGKEPMHVGSLTYDVWGDSALVGVLKEVAAVATGVASTSRMLEEATVTYLKMKDLTTQLATKEGTNNVWKALNLMQATKSAINAVAVDSEDGDLDQFNADFSGLPEIIQMLLQCVSGGADIPITRLLGQSPGGLNSTGESDLQNYYDRLKGEQEGKLMPAFEQINAVLIPSALGGTREEFEMEFNPLWQLTEKEQVEMDGQKVVALQGLSAGGHVPDKVMKEVTQNIMSDSATFAGASKAYEGLTAAEFNEMSGGDPSTEEMEEALQIGDSRPMSLYVHRKVTNSADIVAWAKSQGFKTTLEADDLHVTIAYSRAQLDWHKCGQSWEETITIPAGGPRSVERFGSSAIVLEISADTLGWRHQQIMRAGGTNDFPEYRPHITISFNAEGVDIEKLEPFQGKIELGPEIFQKVKEDWKSGVSEK